MRFSIHAAIALAQRLHPARPTTRPLEDIAGMRSPIAYWQNKTVADALADKFLCQQIAYRRKHIETSDFDTIHTQEWSVVTEIEDMLIEAVVYPNLPIMAHYSQVREEL